MLLVMIGRVEKNRSRFPSIDSRELENRKHFIVEVRKLINECKGTLSDPENKRKIREKVTQYLCIHIPQSSSDSLYEFCENVSRYPPKIVNILTKNFSRMSELLPKIAMFLFLFPCQTTVPVLSRLSLMWMR